MTEKLASLLIDNCRSRLTFSLLYEKEINLNVSALALVQEVYLIDPIDWQRAPKLLAVGCRQQVRSRHSRNSCLLDCRLLRAGQESPYGSKDQLLEFFNSTVSTVPTHFCVRVRLAVSGFSLESPSAHERTSPIEKQVNGRRNGPRTALN